MATISASLKDARTGVASHWAEPIPARRFILAVGLIAFLIPILVAVSANPHRFYLITADGDINFVYEALRLNSGLSQYYHDHTGYTLFVLLAWWFQIVKALGLSSVASLADLPEQTSDAFVAAYSNLVFSARYFVALASGVFAVLFYWSARRLTGHEYVAAAAGLIFAASMGLAHLALMILTELPSSLFLLAGMTLVLTTDGARRPYWRLGAGALCVTIALMGKLQAIFPALALPAMAVCAGPLGRARGPGSGVQPRLNEGDFFVAAIAGTAASIPAWHMIYTSIAFSGMRGPGALPYQPILVLYVLAAIALYGWLYRKGWKEIVLAGVSVSAGISAAFYFHLLYHSMGAIDRLVNFVEHLFMVSSFQHRFGSSPSGLPWGDFRDVVFSSIGGTLGRRFSVSGVFGQPSILLYWGAAAGLVVLVAKRRIHAAIVVAALLAAAILIESAFGLYKTEPKVVTYIETWSILAAAMTASYLWSSSGRLIPYAAAATFLGVFALEIINLVRVNPIRPLEPEYTCGLARDYMPMLERGFERYCLKPSAPAGQ